MPTLASHSTRLKVISIMALLSSVIAVQDNCFSFPTRSLNGFTVVTLPPGTSCEFYVSTPERGAMLTQVQVDYTPPVQVNRLDCPPLQLCNNYQVYNQEAYLYRGDGRNRYYSTYYVSNWASESNSFAVKIDYDGSFRSGATLSQYLTLVMGALAVAVYSLV